MARSGQVGRCFDESPGNDDTGRAKQFAFPKVAPPDFGVHTARSFRVALDQADGLVKVRVERLPFANKWTHVERPEQFLDSPVRKPESIGDGALRAVEVGEGAVEVVHDVEERQEYILPPGVASTGGFSPRTAAIVVELGEQSDVLLATVGEIAQFRAGVLSGRHVSCGRHRRRLGFEVLHDLLSVKVRLTSARLPGDIERR